MLFLAVTWFAWRRCEPIGNLIVNCLWSMYVYVCVCCLMKDLRTTSISSGPRDIRPPWVISFKIFQSTVPTVSELRHLIVVHALYRKSLAKHANPSAKCVTTICPSRRPPSCPLSPHWPLPQLPLVPGWLVRELKAGSQSKALRQHKFAHGM